MVILPVSVGENPNWINLEKYATQPVTIYNTSTYDDLKSKIGDIVNEICTGRLWKEEFNNIGIITNYIL